MKKNYLLIITLLSFAVYGQDMIQKTYLDFSNEMAITYPGCEDAVNKAECLSQKIGELVAAAINERHKIEPFTDALIKIKISLKSESSGALLVSNIETNDSLAVAIAGVALEKLPDVAPKTDELGDNVATSHGFTIVLQRDYHNNLYSAVNNTKTHEWLKMPHPYQVRHAVFEGCVPEDKFLSGCFWENFNAWKRAAFEDIDHDKFQGQKARLVITVSTDGTTDYYTVEGPPKLKKAIEKALDTAWEYFPRLQPGSINGQLSQMSYKVPVEF